MKSEENPHRLAAVIVEYQSGDLLECSIRSLLSQEISVDPVVVVANSPVDVAAVEGLDARVQVLKSTNVGYGTAANRGVAQTPQGYDVLVMNPDIVLAPGAVPRLMQMLADRPQAGAVGPQLRSPHDGSVVRTCSRLPAPLDELVQQSRLRRTRWGRRRLARLWLSDWDRRSSRSVDVLSGACMLLRRSAYDEVGGFDESYFLYWEEVDLCHRLGRSMWERWYCADAQADHLSGGSSDGCPIRKHYVSSRRHYMRTHYRVWSACSVDAALRAYDFARLASRIPRQRVHEGLRRGGHQ